MTETVNDKYVFVSYVRDDLSTVDRLCEELKDNRIRFWRDLEALEPGDFWQDSIRRAINDGAYFVACFSGAYFQRHRTYMNTEIGLAIEELAARPRDSKWFIPVRLSDCSIPAIPIGGLRTLQDIHAISLHQDWLGGIARLMKVLGADASRTTLDSGHHVEVDGDERSATAPKKLKDLREKGDYDPGYKLLSPEERILLCNSSRPDGVTFEWSCSQFALPAERLRACLDRLVDEELLRVQEFDGQMTWRLSNIGDAFLRGNYWARLV